MRDIVASLGCEIDYGTMQRGLGDCADWTTQGGVEMAWDWVSVLEASYSLESDERAWAARVLEATSGIVRGGASPHAFRYNYTSTQFVVTDVIRAGAVDTPTAGPAPEKQRRERMSEVVIDLVYRAGNQMGSVSDLVLNEFPQLISNFGRIHSGEIGDQIGMAAHSGTGEAIGFSYDFAQRASVDAAMQRRWARVASHLGAALRLRKVVKDFSLDGDQVEAIFDSRGRLCDAKRLARKAPVRERLRSAIQLLDRARANAQRHEPDEALDLWEGLVEGRWSLVEHFDHDGRRFTVAIRNEPTHRDPRGLSQRERQVAEFVGLGQSGKQISYTLGLSHSSVTKYITSVQRKLGLASRAEVASFFAPNGVRRKLAEVSLAGESLMVGAYPLVDASAARVLTHAEQAVLALLLAGSTNSDIAQRRGTSLRTVANQVQSIFKKFDVSSRGLLAARMQSEPGAAVH